MVVLPAWPTLGGRAWVATSRVSKASRGPSRPFPPPSPYPYPRLASRRNSGGARGAGAAEGRGAGGRPLSRRPPHSPSPARADPSRVAGSLLRVPPFTSTSYYGLFPNMNLASTPSPSRVSVCSARGGAREGAEVGRNVSGRLGLQTEFSLLVATPTMC